MLLYIIMRNTIIIWFVWLDPTSIYNMHIMFKRLKGKYWLNYSIRYAKERFEILENEVELNTIHERGPF